MKIALASQSEIKVSAIRAAFGDAVELVTFDAPSNVNEQPIGEETLRGAKNRIAFIKAACPDADLYISIENGLFIEEHEYVDRAVVSITTREGHSFVTYSDGVVFPHQYVEETRNKDGGFKTWTVGKIMAEAGFITKHNDPHSDLGHQSRSAYIVQAVQAAAKKLGINNG